MALRARAVSASTADQQNAAAGKQFLVPGEPVRTNRTAFGEIQNTKVQSAFICTTYFMCTPNQGCGTGPFFDRIRKLKSGSDPEC
jgi:hypothetical protein